MAKYRITGPDGNQYDITAPDDATEDQVLAYAQQNYQAPAATAAPKTSPQELQARAAQGDQAAAQEFAARYKASTGEDYKSVDTTAGMSGVDKFRAGFAKSAVDTYDGLGQFAGLVDQATIDERALNDRQIMDTGAGLAGNITGQIAQMAVPAGGGAKVVSYSGRGAKILKGALGAAAYATTQPVVTGDTRLGNAAEGAAWGAGGAGLSGGLSRVSKGLADKIPEETKVLYEAAKAAGIPVHYSQLSDSFFVKKLSQLMKYVPLSGAKTAGKNQQEAYNAALGKTFGADNARNLGDVVMSDARNKISGLYQDVYSRNPIRVDAGLYKDLGKIKNTISTDLTDDAGKVANAQVDKIVNQMKAGEMTGQKYQNLRAELANVAKSNPAAASAIKEARNALDKAARRSVGPMDAKVIDKANRQWANVKLVEKALKQVEGAKGNVKPSALWNLVNQKGGSTSEMRDLAKVGQFLKEGVPDSGTPGGLITGGIATGGTAFGGVSALPAIAALTAVGAGTGRVLNSPKFAKYVAEGGGDAIQGLARKSEKALPMISAASGNVVAAQPSQVNEILAAAIAQPDRGPEILSNLPEEQRVLAAIQFGKQFKMSPQEVLKRAQAEKVRVESLMSQ